MSFKCKINYVETESANDDDRYRGSLQKPPTDGQKSWQKVTDGGEVETSDYNKDAYHEHAVQQPEKPIVLQSQSVNQKCGNCESLTTNQLFTKFS